MKIRGNSAQFGHLPRIEAAKQESEALAEKDFAKDAAFPEPRGYDRVVGFGASSIEAARPEDYTSILGAGSNWHGNLNTEGSVRLDGEVSGEIKAPSYWASRRMWRRSSDLSSWIVGDVIAADGGTLAAGGWCRTPVNWTNKPIMKQYYGTPAVIEARPAMGEPGRVWKVTVTGNIPKPPQ
jgi:hypothetical protein